MKILLSAVVIFLCLSFVSIENPLQDTKWGTGEFMMHFTKGDTVNLYMENDLRASAVYKIKDSVLTWKDATVTEMSCDTALVGKYIYHIKDNVLSFTLVKDECDERGEVLPTISLSKQ